MIKTEIIGNIGADAVVKTNNGNSFITFRVANTDKWTNKATGEMHADTTWISCVLNITRNNLVQYLTKGTKVFVRGIPSFNIYSSPKTKQMEVGINLVVTEIELCGSTKTNANEMGDNNQPREVAGNSDQPF